MIGKVVKMGLFAVLMLAMAGCRQDVGGQTRSGNAGQENGGQTNGGEAGTSGQIGDEVSSGQTGAGGANATCKVGSETCSCDSKGECSGTLRCASKICIDPGKQGTGGAVGAGGSTGTGGKTAVGNDDSCDEGHENCSCYPNITCNSGLTCLSGLCVKQGSSETTGNGGTIGIGGETTQGGAIGISGSTTCPLGTETCLCLDNGTCMGGLTCASRHCVNLSAGNGGSTGIDGTLGAGGATTCETGSERCLCYGNGTCNSPFSCYSNRCVDATGLIGAGGTVGAGGTDGTGGQDSAAGQASNGGTAGTGDQAVVKEQYVTFDLPEGWSRDTEEPVSDRAIWWYQTADGVKPHVLLDAGGGAKRPNEDVRKSAQDDYAERLDAWQEQNPPRELMPIYEEKNIAGTDVFISADVGHYWGAWSYYSNFWFEKDGNTYMIMLDDLVGNQEDAIATVIRTIRPVTK